ncbi:uncharacterized protein [Miscanthus floridulus]|uniref:uncharacterized protein isoform X2 n=1 Tax=Miscanthus floridulus TaxID=154761 RepID=UPI0034599BD4
MDKCYIRHVAVCNTEGTKCYIRHVAVCNTEGKRPSTSEENIQMQSLQNGKFALFCDSCLESKGAKNNSSCDAFRFLSFFSVGLKRDAIKQTYERSVKAAQDYGILKESPESLVRTFVLSLIYACLCRPTLFDDGTMVPEVA